MPSAVHASRLASLDQVGETTLDPAPPSASTLGSVPSGRIVRSEPSKATTARRPGRPAGDPGIVVVVGPGTVVAPDGRVVVVVVEVEVVGAVVVVARGVVVVVGRVVLDVLRRS